MLERINDMPEGTIGLSARGTVTAADCEEMLLPMVAGGPSSSGRTGVLLLFGPEFDDFEADPVDGYAQFAFHRWRDFGQLALASDVDWLRKAVTLLAPFMRGEVRLFHDYEVEQAKTWIASRPRSPALANGTRSQWR
jgi:hypothetical protein